MMNKKLVETLAQVLYKEMPVVYEHRRYRTDGTNNYDVIRDILSWEDAQKDDLEHCDLMRKYAHNAVSAIEATGYALVPKDFMDEEDLWPVLRGHEILKRKVAEMRESGEFAKEKKDE